MQKQRTLKEEATCDGVGLHSGRKVKLSLKPAGPDRGIVFRRVDASGIEIPAKAEFLSHINHATCLAKDGVRIETIEHLLAALNALGVDNAVVELDGPEVPIMDGSAAPFIYLIHEAGIRTLSAPRAYLELSKPISVGDDGRFVAAYPCDRLRLTYTINFDHPLLKHQEY